MKTVLMISFLALPVLSVSGADSVRQVGENVKLEQEISELQSSWANLANANKKRGQVVTNNERVIAQQQQLIAAINAAPIGAVNPEASVIAQLATTLEQPKPESLGSSPLVFSQRFDHSFLIAPADREFASIQTLADGKPALVINMPKRKKEGNPILLVGLKTDDLAGAKVKFSIQVKAENISKPQANFHGGKFGLMLTDNRGTTWPDAFIGGGSFDWKTLSFTVDIPYGVQSAAVVLGMQETTGKIMFRNLKVEIVE